MGVLEGGRRAAQGSVCTWLTLVACPRPGVLLCLRVRAARVASCPWSAMSAPQWERAQRTHPGPRRRVHRLALRLLHTTVDTRPHFRMTVMYICSRVCVCLASERAPTTPFTCVESVLASGQRSARSRMRVLFLACLVAVQNEPFYYREKSAPVDNRAPTTGGHGKKALAGEDRQGVGQRGKGGRHHFPAPLFHWYLGRRGKRWELARQRCCRRPS